MTISVSDCPRFLDSPRMRRWVSFHVLLGSEMEFRHHLPVVLRIHTLPSRMCIKRTAGRCCRNSVSDQSRAWKLTSSTHPRAVQKTWTIRNRYGHRYAEIRIPPTVSVSDGRRLTGLRTTTVSKRGQLYLGWRWRKASGAVASRCSGETKQCRHDCSADKDDRDHRGAPGPLRHLLLYKRRNTSLLLEKFSRTSPV